MSPAIQFHNVSKKFRISLARPRAFQDMLVWRRVRAPHEDFWALQDVSFEIQPGEAVGLIGPNGSGKSTILKLISRIIEPSSGAVTARGRIASLLELGAGFHPDLTGRENIFLNASILGIPRNVIKRRIEGIIDFAQIGRFIDVPVRNYSTGMAMRLGFAITTTLDPDILLIDEILAVGDYSFQRKCLERLHELRTRGVTTVFVSHSLDQVQSICRRAIWMSQGKVRADGEAESVIGTYLNSDDRLKPGQFTPRVKAGTDGVDRWGTYQAEITDVELLDARDRKQVSFETGGYLRLRIHYQAYTPIAQPAFGLAFYRSDGLHMNGPNTVMDGHEISVIDGRGYVDYTVEHLPLASGYYELAVSIYSHDCAVAHDHHHRLYAFEVRDRRSRREVGIVHIPARWQHSPENQQSLSGDSVRQGRATLSGGQ